MPFKSERQRRWMWANNPEMAEEWEEEEKNESRRMKITKRQLRRIIREAIEDPKGALAAAQEMGYSLNIPITVDSNQIAIDDALAGYPGEFTYDDIAAAVASADVPLYESNGSGMPAGNVIGYIEADIDGDYRYNQQLRVIHNPSTDEITIIVQDAGAVGGMDYHGPGEGRSDYYTHGRPQVLPAGAKGKDLVAAIRNMIKQTADTIRRYGKPTRNFAWGENTWSRGPKGLNAKLANAALQKARAQGVR